MTTEMCPGCFHSISWHYNDVRGVARCRADFQPPRSQGFREELYGAVPCDCAEFQSELAEQQATKEAKATAERKLAIDRLVEQIKEARTEVEESPALCTTSGKPIDERTREINPATGMQNDYIVLCPDERAKGFVRPVRRSYRHVGVRPKYEIRDLTEEEKERHGKYGYVKYEEYPESESPKCGRFWTEAQLKSGCGTVTTMGHSIAETFARDPKFYGGGFCCRCATHFPVEEFVWEGTRETVGS